MYDMTYFGDIDLSPYGARLLESAIMFFCKALSTLHCYGPLVILKPSFHVYL